MSMINKQELRSISSLTSTRNLSEIAAKTGNLYESLVVIAKRANQINADIKHELHAKLQEFAPTTDNLEEIFENSEQIEISRFYERMPNPTLLATQEFVEDKIFSRYPENS